MGLRGWARGRGRGFHYPLGNPMPREGGCRASCPTSYEGKGGGASRGAGSRVGWRWRAAARSESLLFEDFYP